LVAVGTKGVASEDMVIALIEKGAPLAATFVEPRELYRQGEGGFVKTAVATAIVEGAISTGKSRVFERLSKSAEFKTIDKEEVAIVFAETAAGCSPAIVDLAVSVGIAIDSPTRKKPDEGADYPYGNTALMNLSGGYGACGEREGDRLLTAKQLIGHGADTNHKNSRGETALFNVFSVPVFKLLMDSGADPKAVDLRGLSALFSTATDVVAFGLLEAGANPAGLTEYCETVLDRADGYGELAGFVQWLKSHPAAWKDKAESKRPCTRPEL
jgi:hypothetical protein